MDEFSEVPRGKKETGKVARFSLAHATEASPTHPERNEDSFFTGPNGFGVFDGVGGLEGGQLAARAARDFIRERLAHFSLEFTVNEAKDRLKKEGCNQ